MRVSEVADTDAKGWKLSVSQKEQSPVAELLRDNKCLVLRHIAALSPDSTMRIHVFDFLAEKVNLPKTDRDEWRQLFVTRALDDDEFAAYQSDLADTPIQKAQVIANEITKGQSQISSLVPPSRTYFERLVGVYDGTASIRDYAANSCKKLFSELAAWSPYEGLLHCLLLSSHSYLTNEINVDGLSNEDLARALDFLFIQGDRISQLGAIEVGFRMLPTRPEICQILIKLVRQIRDDDIDQKSCGFNLLSSLFVLVDGELSRIRLFATEPPFYRRLAALSQAALIFRQLANTAVDADKLFEWAMNIRGELFYYQSLADMRTEPRWNPNFAVASQMKADFLGRLMISAKNHEKNITDSELSSLVLGSDAGSLRSVCDPYHPYLPGPLEGGEASQHQLPPEFLETIEAQLRAEEVVPASFIALVNSAFMFRVEADQAELAAKALKLGSYRLAKLRDKSQLLSILKGLATVAAVGRSRMLADELRFLVRRYRLDIKFALGIDDTVEICLMAAASSADPNEWRDFVGDWLTEQAFWDLNGDEGVRLSSHIRCLCHAVPELWISCGRADAALMAYNQRV